MKKLNRILAIVLALALALSMVIPVTAAAEPRSEFTAKVMRLLQDKKSPYPADVYVYPYAQTYDASVIKGGSTLLQFKCNRETHYNDYFCFGIYEGSVENFEKLAEQGKEPKLIEVRTFEMSKFSAFDRALATTWTADSRYPVGDYTLAAFVMSATGNVYEQYLVVADLHVVSKEIPATELEIYKYWNDNLYQAGDGFPETHDINSTVCYEMYALPLNNTSDRTITVSSTRPDVVYPYVDAGRVYLDFRGLGKADISITYGKLKGELMIYSVSDNALTKFEIVPGETELCVGMTDRLRVDYAPSNIPVAPEWYTSDPSVATVNNGVVTAVGAGTVTISANLSGKSDEVTYTVTEHNFPEEPTERERTATKPAMIAGHCSLCDQDVAVEILGEQIFVDTDYKAWYSEHVDYVYDQKLMNGTGERTFGPDMALSRAMVVTVLYRAAGSPEVEGENPFNDVEAGQWYSDAIVWASRNEVVNGVGNGRFDPNGSITREQIATILYRYTENLGVEMGEGADLDAYPDGVAVADFAKEGMAWSLAEGLISGTVSNGVTTLSPKHNATRAQFATIISRYLQMFPAVDE